MTILASLYAGIGLRYIYFRANFTEDMYKKYWLDYLGGAGSNGNGPISPSSIRLSEENKLPLKELQYAYDNNKLSREMLLQMRVLQL